MKADMHPRRVIFAEGSAGMEMPVSCQGPELLKQEVPESTRFCIYLKP